MFKTDFGYTDEFGQENRLIKTYTDVSVEEMGTLQILVDDFKLMLIASGFDQSVIDKLKFSEEE